MLLCPLTEPKLNLQCMGSMLLLEAWSRLFGIKIQKEIDFSLFTKPWRGRHVAGFLLVLFFAASQQSEKF